MDEIICQECGTEFNRLFWDECPNCSGASNAPIVLHPVHLGMGVRGANRRKALESLAKEAGYIWGSKPSIGRWLVALADKQLEKEFDQCQKN